MKIDQFLRVWAAKLAIMTVMVKDSQSLLLPNPMKCFEKFNGVQNCIIPKLDDSIITDSSLKELIPDNTTELTIFCTSKVDNTLSQSAFHHLRKLHKLLLWNCLFYHFPHEALENLLMLNSLSFHMSVPLTEINTGVELIGGNDHIRIGRSLPFSEEYDGYEKYGKEEENKEQKSFAQNVQPFADVNKHSVNLLCTLTQLTELSITGYNIQIINNTLPCFMSNCCSHIVMLNFTTNNISIILEEMFAGLENVKILDLSWNTISILPTNAFSRLTNLKKIILTSNQLQQISFQMFKLNLELSEIEIEENDISSTLPTAPDIMTVYNKWQAVKVQNYEDCTEYGGLETAHLQFLKKPTSFSMCIRNWNDSNPVLVESLLNVQNLYLKYYSKKGITFEEAVARNTPPFVTLVLQKLVNLTQLTLEYPSLKPYPKMFTNLNGLQHLTLLKVIENYTIPSGVFDGLHKLQALTISGDEPKITHTYDVDLSDIPRQIPQLKELHVFNGKYSISLEGFISLETISIRNVDSYNVPQPLCNGENSINVKNLILQNNSIFQLQKRDFRKCHNLLLLDLSYNAIRSFFEESLPVNLNASTSPFFSLQKLTTLVLYRNSIRFFDFFLIPKSLLHLDLGFNQISTFTDKSNIRNIFQLESLKLNDNRIFKFESNIFPLSVRQIFLGRSRNYQENKLQPFDISEEYFSNLKNLEILRIKHERKMDFRWTIPPSRKGAYVQVEEQYLGTSILRTSPKTANFIQDMIYGFRIIKYYDNSTLQHLYCKYFKKHTCVGNECGEQKQLNAIEQRSTKVLDCSNTQFQTFPSMFPHALLVDQLFLDGNNFANVPSYALNTLAQSPKVLYLNNSQISTIDEFAFYNHSGIQELHLEYNNISFIPEHMMPPSPLQFLFLQNNNIKEIGNLKRFLIHPLQELHLENNMISSLPSNLCDRIDIAREIYLDNNHILSFAISRILSCRNLDILTIRNNSMSVIGTMPTTLQFSGEITSDTTQLVNIDLSNNKIKTLPKFKMPLRARNVVIIGNIIRRIRASGFLKPDISLSQLNLNNNDIDHIEPFTFEEVEHLQRLFLNDNLLSHLHGEEFITVTNFTNLEILRIANNHIRSMDNRTFRNMISLEVLDLSGNQISTFNATIFDQLIHLKQLFLNKNHIKSLFTEFDKLFELQELFMNDNLMSSLNKNTFQNLHNLKKLFLDNNKLVSPDVWQLPRSLKVIGLINNSLTCDCDFMLEFLNWLNDQRLDKSRDIGVDHCVRGNEFVSLQDFDKSLCRISYELIFGSCMGVLLVLFFALCILYYKRLEVQVWVYSRYGIRLFYKNEEQDKRCDVFVAYSTDDEEFVINDLLPGLREYRICIHFKDFMPGSYINEAIVEAVENSCRTLLIFSPHFLQSPWCKFEFKMAHNKSLQDRCCRLILLLLEDVDEENMDQEQKAYLRTNTYLRWNDRMFWEKLKFALPNVRRGIPEEDNRMIIELPVLNN